MLGAVSTITDITPIHDLQEQRTLHILGISHGLWTPLTVVQGQAQLLLRALERERLDGGMRRSAEAIITSSRRMSVVLRDLVDLADLEIGRPLKLNAVLRFLSRGRRKKSARAHLYITLVDTRLARCLYCGHLHQLLGVCLARFCRLLERR